jgi:hypothetical protein
MDFGHWQSSNWHRSNGHSATAGQAVAEAHRPICRCLNVTESDILEPSEAFRHRMDYYSHTKHADRMIERLAAMQPTTMACMHGPAWRGDGAALLRALGARLTADAA